MRRATIEHYRGSLLGGAIGDALGATIEFDSIVQIRNRFGAEGLRDFGLAYGGVGAVTDDTQMTLFSAEALLRAEQSGRTLLAEGHAAYLRWLHTQDARWSQRLGEKSGLVELPDLHQRRAPGGTCLSALHSGRAGTVGKPINDSKGCGGVMRVAPVGLTGSADPFLDAVVLAAITHGHPSGYLSAGALSQVIAELVEGASLADSIEVARRRLLRERGHEETLAAIDAAVQLSAEGEPTAEKVETLGGGWVGEQALAIGLYCSLVAKDFKHGVLLAVNHTGDSDSTGSIAGNILGLLHGEAGIPERWRVGVEFGRVIAQMADDLHAAFAGKNSDKGE